MHIKTNIEHSSVQIIVLAICPLLLVVSSVNDAVLFVCGTVLCLLISQMFINLFNKYLSNNVKAMLTAIISALLVIVATILVKEKTDKVLPDNFYFVIFSTTILNAEFIYFNNRALTKHYFFSILKNLLVFALITFMYALIKEFLAFGTIYGKQLFTFSGVKFFETMIFNLLLLATLCVGFDYFVRKIDKAYETKNMVYQKYVKIIRDEKTFQYDKLRREKLLGNEIEVNRVNKEDAEKIAQKISENEAIESVKEVVSEETEIVEPKEEDEKVEEIKNPEVDVEAEEKDDKKSKKRRKKGDK